MFARRGGGGGREGGGVGGGDPRRFLEECFMLFLTSSLDRFIFSM